jgi:hypothetical protein
MTRFAKLSDGKSAVGIVPTTHAAMTTACATMLSVALVPTGVVFEYEFAHKRIIWPPPPCSSMRELPSDRYAKYRSRSSAA